MMAALGYSTNPWNPHHGWGFFTGRTLPTHTRTPTYPRPQPAVFPNTTSYTDSSIPLRNHISTIRSYAEALEWLHSDKPSDTQIIARIFTSLPSSYSTIIKILKNSKKADNLDYITERILAEETTQKSADNSMIRPSGSSVRHG